MCSPLNVNSSFAFSLVNLNLTWKPDCYPSRMSGLRRGLSDTSRHPNLLVTGSLGTKSFHLAEALLLGLELIEPMSQVVALLASKVGSSELFSIGVYCPRSIKGKGQII